MGIAAIPIPWMTTAHGWALVMSLGPFASVLMRPTVLQLIDASTGILPHLLSLLNPTCALPTTNPHQLLLRIVSLPLPQDIRQGPLRFHPR